MNSIDGADEPVTLSREDLYELAWSKPMSELARDFGTSDVALAKRCRRLGIPVLSSLVRDLSSGDCRFPGMGGALYKPAGPPSYGTAGRRV